MADKLDLKEAPSRDEMQVTLSPDAGQSKVELDLDDAPFLHTEEENAPAEVEEGKTPAVPDEAVNPAASKKKKLLMLAGAGAALLLALGAAVWWFFLRSPSVPPEGPKPEVIVVPAKPPVAAAPDYVKEFAPFLVERPDGKGGSRFLVCKFSTLTKVPNLDKEMDQKMIALRDALYYYLRSKSNDYLTAPEHVGTIKKELTSVLNDYLTQGKIEDVLFESYLSE